MPEGVVCAMTLKPAVKWVVIPSSSTTLESLVMDKAEVTEEIAEKLARCFPGSRVVKVIVSEWTA